MSVLAHTRVSPAKRQRLDSLNLAIKPSVKSNLVRGDVTAICVKITGNLQKKTPKTIFVTLRWLSDCAFHCPINCNDAIWLHRPNGLRIKSVYVLLLKHSSFSNLHTETWVGVIPTRK